MVLDEGSSALARGVTCPPESRHCRLKEGKCGRQVRLGTIGVLGRRTLRWSPLQYGW